jgi:hypothetical protein
VAAEPDVVVCGAGAAGLAAALAAARAGAEVVLVEAGAHLGGTVTHALIHTLGGLYDSAGEFINAGLPRELADTVGRMDPATRKRRIGRTWVLNVSPIVYENAVGQWTFTERRINELLYTRIVGVTCSDKHVTELHAQGTDGAIRLRPRAVVDASGVAAVVRLIDPALLHEDHQRAAGGLIFTLRGVARDALAFPRGLAVVRALHEAAADGTLPPECARTWVDSGVYPDEVYVKLMVAIPDNWQRRHAQLRDAALLTQAAVVAFLRRRPEFAGAQVERTGAIGVRDGGRVRGEYCLTAADVRACRRFEDAAGRCCWPIEYWDPDQGVSLEYLPDGQWYEIPLRSLKVAGWANVWVAGKCLSADRLAQASARVAGTCWAMGEAAGRAAAWEALSCR